jgi:hypothetical protein
MNKTTQIDDEDHSFVDDTETQPNRADLVVKDDLKSLPQDPVVTTVWAERSFSSKEVQTEYINPETSQTTIIMDNPNDSLTKVDLISQDQSLFLD